MLRAGPAIVAIPKKLLTECVLDPQTDWIETIRTPNPAPRVAALRFAAPFQQAVLARHGVCAQLGMFFQVFAQLRTSPFRRGVSEPWEWRATDGLISSTDLFRRVRSHLAAMAPIARAAEAKQNEIAFLLPLMSFGGVEQVGLQVAARFKAAGWRTRVIVTEVNEIKAPERLLKIFDTILFLNDASYTSWRPTELKYFGHELQSWPLNGRHDRLIGLLTGCAAVMILQANHGYEVMGWLRRQGVITINSLHLLDRDLFNAPVGHPYLTLAYEHAFDIVCAPSHKLLAFCAASGVPSQKLTFLGNAPSFRVSPKIAETRLRELDGPETAARNLRVLSIGRLDRQKGGERLAALVSLTSSLGLPIDWRFVGGRVVPDQPAAETELTFEPPVFDRTGMIDRLLWADAIVLLSRWEGSPLIILEAQSLGTIPIATDTGGVCEMIEDGIDGFLLPNTETETVVMQALAALERLILLPELRLQMGRNAMARMQSVTWENTAAGLVERIEKLIADKEQ